MTVELCSRAVRASLSVALVSCAVLAQGGFRSAAGAAPPEREAVTIPPMVAFPFQDVQEEDPCGFPVTLTVLDSKLTMTTFERRDGTTTVHTSGPLKVLFTNTRDPSTAVERNISGPVRTTTEADGSITQVTGGRGVYAFEADEGTGFPRITLFNGRTVATFDADGEFEFLSQRGSYEDLCATLTS